MVEILIDIFNMAMPHSSFHIKCPKQCCLLKTTSKAPPPPPNNKHGGEGGCMLQCVHCPCLLLFSNFFIQYLYNGAGRRTAEGRVRYMDL